MASIKELTEILDLYTNLPDQAIMLRGKSGMGKSEFIRSYYESKNYRVEVLFVGQCESVGDLIGLPQIIDDNNGNSITEFCPPKWFPIDSSDKVVLFLDEVNRAQPEIESALMDLILNRKIQGRPLPATCRIISAINPSDDDSYNVKEMDIAFLDRFNLYEFTPTADEWIEWASYNKIDDSVIGFITRNKDCLDKPTSNITDPDQVTPSRRSWVKVSKLLKHNKNLKSNYILLKNVLDGIVGISIAAKFISYLKTNNDITAGYILTNIHKDNTLIDLLKSKLDVQTSIHMNTQIEIWFRDFIDNDKVVDKTPKEVLKQIVSNLETYLNEIVPVEIMNEFMVRIRDNQSKYRWPNLICSIKPELADKLLDVMIGS